MVYVPFGTYSQQPRGDCVNHKRGHVRSMSGDAARSLSSSQPTPDIAAPVRGEGTVLLALLLLFLIAFVGHRLWEGRSTLFSAAVFGVAGGALIGAGAIFFTASFSRSPLASQRTQDRESSESSRELARTKRLYETLGQLSCKVASETEPDRLLEEACRIIVEVGGFASAWIGILHSERTQLAVRACAGRIAHREPRMLHSVLPFHSQDSLFSALCQDAQSAVIVNDVASDPSIGNAPDHSIDPSVRSFGLFRLRVDGQVVGFLIVHSDRVGTFGAPETELLVRYCETLGLALDHLADEERGRAAEKARLELENRFEAAFRYIPVGMAIAEYISGRYLDCNDAFERIVERPRSEILGKNAVELGIWPLPVPREVVIAQMKDHGAKLVVEAERKRKDGTTLQLRLSAVRIRKDGLDFLVVLAEDLTLEKQKQKAEAESRKLHDQLASVAETVPGVICLFRRTKDGHASMPYASPAIHELYGLSPTEVVADATPIFSRVHPEDVPRVQQAILESAQTGLAWQQDYRFEHPQKGQIWIEGHSKPKTEPDGSVLWVGFVHDVTARKRAEELLRQSEARFRTLFLKSPVAYHSLDEQGCFAEVNDRLCELVGYPREELIGVPAMFLLPNSDRDRVRTAFANFLQSEKRSCEFVILRRDGARLVVRQDGYVQRDGSGRFVRTHCVLHDLTEQRKAEAELRLQSAALEAAANAIVITDPTGVIEWCNPAFTQISGFSSAEAKTRSLGELVRSGEQSRGFYKQMWDTILSGKAWHGELQNRRKDGSRYPEQMSITPLFDENRRITHFIAIKQDISEQKRLEALLLRTQRLESIGRLASGIAHDLNNVLTPMLMAPLMLRSVIDDPIVLQIIDSIDSSAQRGAAIIKQLLTFSRGLPGEKIPLRLRIIARDMVKLIEQTFPKNITLRTRLDRDVWPVLGDATQIHQVLMNLCVNSRDAMPKGGTLTVALESTVLTEQTAQEHGVRPGAYAVLLVEDTGMGISATDLDRIYDPFFTTKPLGEGTGLGLSTALGIVKSHHGVILVESTPHKGTTFRVLLPAHESATSPTSAGASQDVLPLGRGEVIVVVDDEELTRQMIQQILEQYGYHVQLAQSGQQALEMIQQNPEIRLLLTDAMMPGMDGSTLIRQVKALAHRTQVMVMTGLHSQADIIDLIEHYGVQVLDKPFTAQKLLLAVQNALPKNQEPMVRVSSFPRS